MRRRAWVGTVTHTAGHGGARRDTDFSSAGDAGLPARRFNACPSVVRCGVGRDQQLPATVDRGGAVDAPPVQPLRVRFADAARLSRTVDSGRPNPAAMERCPALRARATRAVPIASVLSAQRTVSAVGSRSG